MHGFCGCHTATNASTPRDQHERNDHDQPRGQYERNDRRWAVWELELPAHTLCSCSADPPLPSPAHPYPQFPGAGARGLPTAERARRRRVLLLGMSRFRAVANGASRKEHAPRGKRQAEGGRAPTRNDASYKNTRAHRCYKLISERDGDAGGDVRPTSCVTGIARPRRALLGSGRESSAASPPPPLPPPPPPPNAPPNDAPKTSPNAPSSARSCSPMPATASSSDDCSAPSTCVPNRRYCFEAATRAGGARDRAWRRPGTTDHRGWGQQHRDRETDAARVEDRDDGGGCGARLAQPRRANISIPLSFRSSLATNSGVYRCARPRQRAPPRAAVPERSLDQWCVSACEAAPALCPDRRFPLPARAR